MLILQPGTARSEEAWERRLTAARQALAQRSGKSTDVVLLGYEPDQDAPGSQQQTTDRLSVIPQQLQGAGSGVTKLAVEHTGLLPPTFLTTAASAFPHLHTLSVDQCTCPLPLPAQMPQLRTLQVTIPPPSYNTNDGVWEEHPTTLAVLQSIAAHLPQLTSLDISLEQSEGEEAFNLPWQEILTPASTTHTLTHLTTTDELTDTLITRLIDHAPAIQHVSVAGLYVQTDFHEQGRQWGLQSLVLSCGELYADELALLPACTAGPLSVVGQGSMLGFEVQGRQGLDRRIENRLPSWRFLLFQSINVQLVATHLSKTDQDSSFDRVLEQLGALDASDTPVQLTGWEWFMYRAVKMDLAMHDRPYPKIVFNHPDDDPD